MDTSPYIAILGGDKREVILGKVLSRDHIETRYVGFEKYYDDNHIPKSPLENALTLSDVLIVSLAGVDEAGFLNAPYAVEALRLRDESLDLIKAGSLFITGSLPVKMKAALVKREVTVIETVDRDDVACLNAIPTAEGAILYALQRSERVLQDSNSLVTGFGRCAKALAIRLKSLGSSVSIGARNPSSLAEAELYGYEAVPLIKLPQVIPRYDYIFNTVPTLLFGYDALHKAKPSVVIIDVASKPGGVDLAAAKKISLTALHVLGIPGKTAPLTAGMILAKVYRNLIRTYWEEKQFRMGGDNNEA